MSSRRPVSIASNPVLIGAITVLVVTVSVFLAYNANSGLPFVPTYDVKARVPNAANLVVGNEVRIGGTRVGIVSDITAEHRPGGGAVLALQLDKSLEPLPVDTTVLVRSESALGLKYLEVTVGHASKGFPNGAVMPLANAHPHPVEIDDVLNMFSLPVREASRVTLTTFGDALAVRGEDLNQAIANFPPLLAQLEPAAANLAARGTGFKELFPALGRSAAEVAPVAAQQAQLFAGLDSTFGSLAAVSNALAASVQGGPPALVTATAAFPRQRPFLGKVARLFHTLRPGFSALSDAAPALASAEAAGTPALVRSPALNRRLADALDALDRFAADPRVPVGVGALTDTARLLEPIVAFVAPAQTVCNYLALSVRNASSLLSEGDSVGTWQRFIIVAYPQAPNSEAGPSSAPANGPQTNDPLSANSFLHINPYPNTAAPGQTHECEAGNERYASGRTVIGNAPGNQGTRHDPSRIDRSR